MSKKRIIIVVSTITCLTLIGSATYSVTNVIKQYDRIHVRKIETFAKSKATIFDNKTQLLKDTITANQVAQLKQLATTPAENRFVHFVEVTQPLLVLTQSENDLTTILKAVNQYYKNSDADNDYKEQKTKNQDLVKKVEELITQLATQTDDLSIVDNTLQFNSEEREFAPLSTISTDIRWKDLDQFNRYIINYNKYNELQVTQNKTKDQQAEIINLEEKLKAFNDQVEQTKAILDSNYISGKELKDVLKTLSEQKNPQTSWFTNMTPPNTNNTTTVYTTSFTRELIKDKKLPDWVTSITVQVQLNVESSTTNKKDKVSQKETLSGSLVTSQPNIADTDLVNKDGLHNILYQVTQNQTYVVYEEPKPSSTEESSTQSRSSASSTPSSSETRASSREN